MADRLVKVKRADVYAARTRIELDEELGRETPGWVRRLAAVDLASSRPRGQEAPEGDKTTTVSAPPSSARGSDLVEMGGELELLFSTVDLRLGPTSGAVFLPEGPRTSEEQSRVETDHVRLTRLMDRVSESIGEFMKASDRREGLEQLGARRATIDLLMERHLEALKQLGEARGSRETSNGESNDQSTAS